MSEDVVATWRRFLGVYDALDWPRFLADCGMRYVFASLPEWAPAVLAGRTIVIRSGEDRIFEAFWVWHEAGHHALHVGDGQFWGSRPCGLMILRKMERQATEFALMYPDWDGVTDN